MNDRNTKYFVRMLILGLTALIGAGCSIQGDVVVSGSSRGGGGGSVVSGHLSFASAPTLENAGQTVTTAPVAEVLDDQNQRITSSNQTITLSLSSGTGALSGTVSVAAVNGLATFSNISINDVGTDKKLTASGGTLGTAVTNLFSVAYGPHAVGQADLATDVNLESAISASVRDVMSVAGKLIVADGNNNRVLIWNTIPTTSLQKADVVLGQSTLKTNDPNNGNSSPTAASLWAPEKIYTDGTKLAVADLSNNRVLIWNTIPTSSNTPANLVLGQPNMTSNTANNGGMSAQSLSGPSSVFWIGSKFYVVDSLNSRVLIWNSFPTVNQQAADLVLGQPNMTSNTLNNGGVSAQSLSSPFVAHSDGTKLFVSDYSNHRVLIWNTIPTVNQQAADLVLGQPNMTSNTVNNGGVTAQSMWDPETVQYDGTKFFVVDGDNHRILVWNGIPTVNQQAADFVLGEPDMTTSTGGWSAQAIFYPGHVYSDGSKLYLADGGNRRVLIWNSVPTVTYQAADLALGQPDLTSRTVNYSAAAASNIRNPNQTYTDGTRLVVADTDFSRVLIWNKVPASSSVAPDLVLGQPNMTSFAMNTGGVSSQSMNKPQGVCSDGTRLVVADTSNNRVLIWNTWPTTNDQAADLVLGQPNFTSNTANNGGISAISLRRVYNCFTDGTYLIVTDSANQRVLIWNTFPTVNRQAANVVLGQAVMTTANFGGGATGFWDPFGVAISGTKVIVSDMGNSRVMIWNTIPVANNAAANVVLGQPNSATYTANTGGVTSQSLYNAAGLQVINGILYVADKMNNRILFWNSIPTVTQTAADGVIGQPNFTSNTSNNTGLSGTTLKTPVGVSGFSYLGTANLLISDSANNRVLLKPLP